MFLGAGKPPQPPKRNAGFASILTARPMEKIGEIQTSPLASRKDDERQQRKGSVAF